MTKKIDREAIIAELKREALDEPEIGWLSDLSGRDLEWDERDEVIFFGKWDGSIDVGQLAGIVEGLIGKNSQALLSRLEQAEQAVARVRELCRISEEHAQEYGDTASVYVDDLKLALRALDGEQS